MLPSLSFATTLGGNLISSDSVTVSAGGYANGSVSYWETGGVVADTNARLYFYYASPDTASDVKIWFVNGSGSTPAGADPFGDGSNGIARTVTCEGGSVPASGAVLCYVPVNTTGYTSTYTIILANNHGSSFQTKGIDYSGYIYPYFALTDTSGVGPPASSITPSNPTAQTYVSNPIPFSGTYTNSDTYNQIILDIQNSDTGIEFSNSINIPLVNGVGLSYNAPQILPYVGNYTYKAKLYDSENATSTEWSSSVSFALGTTTVSTSSAPTSGLSLGDCATFDIACYIKQAGIWLFVPSGDSTSQFTNITLRNALPFSYVYDVGTLREELFSSTQTATSTVKVDVRVNNATSTLTFLSAPLMEAVPYTSTINTILGWVMYLLMAEYIYYRVIRVHDSNTPIQCF